MGVVSALGALEGGDASFVSLSELPPPVCPGPFVSSFEFVGAVPQVLGVVSLLAPPEVGVVSNFGMLEDGEASSVSLSELPPPVCPGPFVSSFESVGAGVGGGIAPGGAVGEGGLESWDVGRW